MSQHTIAQVHIMGRMYQIKCLEDEVASLQKAAELLENNMQSIREKSTAFNLEKIAIVSAINLAHQLLAIKNQHTDLMQNVHDKLHYLQNKIELSLADEKQMEFQAVE